MKTELRAKPENNFEKDFFKVIKNCVLGTAIEFKKAQRYQACEHQQSNKLYNVAV